MVIVSHYSAYGGVDVPSLSFGLNSIVLNQARLGDTGVVIFFMISGFFMVYSTKVSNSKIVRLALTALLFMITFYYISISVGAIEFSWKGLYLSVMFIFFGEYWFVVTYLLIYIFHPIINKALLSFTKKELNRFVLILFVFWSLIPTFTLGMFQMNNLISVFTPYTFGAYLQLSKDSPLYTKKNGSLLAIFSFILMMLSVVIITFIGTKIPAVNEYARQFISRHSPLVILFVTGLIIVSAKTKPFVFVPINFIASFTLGIYLIHDNVHFRYYMWQQLIKVPDYALGNQLIPHMFLCVLIVFGVSLIIEITRFYALETPIVLLVRSLQNKRISSKNIEEKVELKTETIK